MVSPMRPSLPLARSAGIRSTEKSRYHNCLFQRRSPLRQMFLRQLSEADAASIRSIASGYEVKADQPLPEVLRDLRRVLPEWACGAIHRWSGWTDAAGAPLGPVS